MDIDEAHINHLLALENDKVKEALINYSAYLKMADDMIYFLSREFLDTIKDENVIFLSFFAQISVDLELAVLSTLRRHDIQACCMLRHALESTCLAAYALFSKSVADEDKAMSEYGHPAKKLYKWIAKEFPEQSENIKKIKEKINDNFSHANIKTSAANLIVRNEKINPTFFDSNSNETVPKRLYVISEITWHVLDLLDQAIKKANCGVALKEDSVKKINEFSGRMDKVFAEFITAKN
ncbi:MAG: hypothetical protein HY796_08835 [Elusimicrobia bacterium]|nr:hypothetical protein [Elusimicrobiota bacterium]